MDLQDNLHKKLFRNIKIEKIEKWSQNLILATRTVENECLGLFGPSIIVPYFKGAKLYSLIFARKNPACAGPGE